MEWNGIEYEYEYEYEIEIEIEIEMHCTYYLLFSLRFDEPRFPLKYRKKHYFLVFLDFEKSFFQILHSFLTHAFFR
jgi:hypothetical protein